MSVRQGLSGFRASGMWLIVAGVLVVARGLMDLGNPIYWRPVTPFDYAAATLTTVAWIVTGVAFVVWARSFDLRRVAIPLVIAGAGVVTSGIGNLLEDVADLDIGEPLYSVGGMMGALAVLGAAGLILTVSGPVRWSAILLVAFIAGAFFPDDGGQYVSGLALVLLGLWLVRLDAPAVSPSADTM